MKRMLVLALLVTLALSATALAQLGGRTYTGTHNGGRGGTVSMKLSGDGTRVVAYSFNQVGGDNCSFEAEGDEGVWEGADIDGGEFSYRLFDSIVLDGRFDGATGKGTLRLRNRRPCDSGVVDWSVATAGEDPPPLPDATPEPTPVPTATPGGSTRPPATRPRNVRTTVTFKRRNARELTGRLSSAERGCRNRRSVTLLRGSRVVTRLLSRSDGTFTFRRSSKTRNQQVRVVIAQRVQGTVVCTAVTSKRVRG